MSQSTTPAVEQNHNRIITLFQDQILESLYESNHLLHVLKVLPHHLYMDKLYSL